jgi:transcriptional repressor NrdR
LCVVKRDGRREPFERAKVVAGLLAATKNRPVTAEQLDELVARVEDRCRLSGPEIASEQIGALALDGLRGLDEVAYVRFASVYKDFAHIDDFQRELSSLAPDPAERAS